MGKPVSAEQKEVSAPTTRNPLYLQVVEAIRQRIAGNVYMVGSVLPAEDVLAAEFKVSRHTIREALRRLRDEGLILSRQGAGTTVAMALKRSTYVQEVDSISDLIQSAKNIHYKVDSTEVIVLDKALAELVGAKPGSKWLRLSGLRYAERRDVPVCKTEVYVSAEFSGVARLVARGHTAIYEMIEDLYGEKIAEVNQSFRGLEASGSVAAELAIEAGEALVEIKRSYFTAGGKLAEVAVNLYPYKQFSFAMKLRSGGPSA